MFAPSLKGHLGRLCDTRKIYDPWEGKVGVEIRRPGKPWEDFLSSGSRSAMGDIVVRTGIQAQLANSLQEMAGGGASEADDDAPKSRFRAPRAAKKGAKRSSSVLGQDQLAQIIRENVSALDPAALLAGGTDEWNRLKLGLATLQMTDWCDGLFEADGTPTKFGEANRLRFLGWVGKSVTCAGRTEYFSLEDFAALKDTRPELFQEIERRKAMVVDFDGPLRQDGEVVWIPEVDAAGNKIEHGGATLSDAFAEVVLNELDKTEAFARQVVERTASDSASTSFGTAGTSAG